ncbi:septum formation initiator family protein [Candidatus Nomurabacteria bacterium]|nr:septum formation initiator family protein [Candidatus Nomurabacteria bacterium]
MRNFQQKRGWKNIIYSRPVLGILAILLFVFVWTVFRFMGKMQITRENRITAENKVTQLGKEKEKLSSDIAKLQTNAGVEESIRDKFGWAKEGEGLIVILDKKNPEEVPKKESNRFFDFFRNWFR